MEERQLDGWWWLPGKEDIQIPGTMTFSPREGVKLVLQGAFRRLEQVGSSLPPTVILGIAGGRFVTLVDCLGSKQQLTMPGGLREEFLARLAYLGAHLTDPQDVRFTKAKVKLTHLEDWAGKSGFEFDYEHDGSHVQGFSLKYRYPEEVSARTRVGSIVVSFGFTTKIDLLAKAEIGQSAHLRFQTPEALTLDDWLRQLVGPLQDFLTLATRQPSGLAELKFQVDSSTEVQPEAGGQSEDVEVLFRSRYVDAKGGSRLVRHDMLFTLNDITSDFEVSLDAWLGAVDDLDSVCNLFFSVSYTSEMYLHSQFLNFVQAAESYHRRRMSNEVLSRSDHRKRVESVLAAVPDEHSEWLREQLNYSNEPRLKQRLTELISLVEPVAAPLVGDKEGFIRRTLDTRNYLTHWDQRLKDKAATGQELYDLTEALSVLVEACLVRELGIDGDRLVGLFKENERYRRAAAAGRRRG